jgi:hypothetical protein
MTYIKYFDIVGRVIESNTKSISERISREKGISYEDARLEIIDSIIKHLVINSREWASGCQPNIHYEDPTCRMAYLYRIVPVNANLLEYVFENDAEIEEYLLGVQNKIGEVRICVFGGGPGTELLGLAKRIEKRRFKNQIVLNFLLLDEVNEWLESWRAIRKEIDSKFRNSISLNRNDWPLTTSGDFCALDITNIDNFDNWGAVFDQDIYIFSYIISEVFDNYPQLKNFIAKMAAQSPEGAKFLFIDRVEKKWKDVIIDIAKNAGIVISEFHDTASSIGVVSRDEEKTDLGQIYVDVMKRYSKGNPRLGWKAFWIVGTKE